LARRAQHYHHTHAHLTTFNSTREVSGVSF
jgi:hypothetical protein